MYSIYEISLIIIAIIVLFIYLKTTYKSDDCDAEEDFGNFTSSASTSPVIAFINAKSKSTTDINIKKKLFIPQIFSNNVFYKDADYGKVSKMSVDDLGAYIKNNNIMYFIDLLNQFTQDICSHSEFKLLLTMFANNYIQFKNIPSVDQEATNILSNHMSLYTNVKRAQKLYNDLLSTNKFDQTTYNQTSTQIDSILNNIIQQMPQIDGILKKIKSLQFTNNYTTINETVDKNSINSYKKLMCKVSDLAGITSSKSKFLFQIKSYNSPSSKIRFSNNNIIYWIPFYVQINLSETDINQSNINTSLEEVFTSIIFPKIFNYSLTLIDLMNELNDKENDDTINDAIEFFNKYVASYLIIYMNVITDQIETDTLLQLQKLESSVKNLYDLIMAA
jgi:hypothetical protein